MLSAPQDAALVEVGRALQAEGYRFTTITPASHARIIARRRRAEPERPLLARNLRDIFGWNLPFAPCIVEPELLALMRAADIVEPLHDGLTSRVRFSSIADDLFVHSRFPTQARDTVFFGPDTYRFCKLLRERAPHAEHAVDMGCGSGAGGLVIRDRVKNLTLGDVNMQALRYAQVNTALACCDHVQLAESDCMGGVSTPCDLIVANPPYVVDPHGRTYRNGGGTHGVTLAQRMTREALARLSPGGTYILYTGTPVVDGCDMFWDTARTLITPEFEVDYFEIDPDVFGEELDEPAYASVDRLCVVALIARRKR